ncbi:MAG TPA: LON peptidase substrate-binding domain-containing protein [Intrasporangiaceae bacterium]|nr:LON peptidase substrate-binding domain-containing protein [Intrasporangiaceae bacterium]
MPRLPLFPLGTVLFPGARLPLRIFEPRYLALLRHLVELPPAERQFGVVSLQRGHEVGAGTPVQLARTGTTAQVITIRRGLGGPAEAIFAVETVGRRRFRLESYAADDSPYYVGSVTWLSDEPCDPDELREAAGEARAAFEAFQVAAGGGPEIGDPAPEELAYAIAQAVALPLPDRQALLDTDNPLARLRLLVRLLRREAVLFGGLRLAPAERSSFGSPSQN